MGSFSTDDRDIRKLGAACLCFFGLLFALALWREKFFASYIFGFLTVLGLGFLILPGPLRPLYRAWLKIARFIGVVMTAVILTLSYYVVVTPTALLKRVFGGRPVPTAPERNAATYWVSRPEPAQPKERFVKRY